LATNRLRAFDVAIIRPGRFDMQLFVGTPNLESRIIQFKQQLQRATSLLQSSSSSLSSSSPSSSDDDNNNNNKRTTRRRIIIDIEKTIESYRSFLKSSWQKDTMFMNYLEGLQFADACIQSMINIKNIDSIDKTLTTPKSQNNIKNYKKLTPIKDYQNKS